MSNNQDLVRLADACRFENSGNNYTVRGFVKKVNYVPASGRGASYIDITIVDSTGEFPGKLFGDQRLSRDDAVKMNGHIVEMTAMIEVVDMKPRFNVTPGQWRVLNDAEVSDWSKYAYFLTDEDKETLADYIREFIDSMDGSRGLKELTSVLFEKHVVEMGKLPAGHEWHHAYNGGLLRHIAEKLFFVGRENPLLTVGAPYRTMYDRDLVIAGCVLSDLDKVRDVTPFPRGEKTYHSRMRSTTEVIFREEVLPLAAKLMKRKKKGMTEAELEALEHVMLAGSINASGGVKAYTIEANLVALADRLSVETDHYGCFAAQNYTRTDAEQYSKLLGRYIAIKCDENNE